MSEEQPNQQLAHVLAQARWHVRPERFVLAGVAPRERRLALQLLVNSDPPFMQCIVEPDVVTLLLPEPLWRELQAAFPHARVQQFFRVIAFESDLPPDLVGFLATITAALARANVSLLAVCAYAKDYVLVREADLDAATQALNVVFT